MKVLFLAGSQGAGVGICAEKSVSGLVPVFVSAYRSKHEGMLAFS